MPPPFPGMDPFIEGHIWRVFRKLEDFVRVRMARNLARSQPKGRKRKHRSWTFYIRHHAMREVPSLSLIQRGSFTAYRGKANVRWRAV